MTSHDNVSVDDGSTLPVRVSGSDLASSVLFIVVVLDLGVGAVLLFLATTLALAASLLLPLSSPDPHLLPLLLLRLTRHASSYLCAEPPEGCAERARCQVETSRAKLKIILTSNDHSAHFLFPSARNIWFLSRKKIAVACKFLADVSAELGRDGSSLTPVTGRRSQGISITYAQKCCAYRKRAPIIMSYRQVVRCYHCNEAGHMAKVCPQKPPQLCFNCGKPGHIKRECPALGAQRGGRRHHAPYNGGAAPAPGREQTAPLVEVTGSEKDTTGERRRSQPAEDGNPATPQPTHACKPRPLSPPVEAPTSQHPKFIDTHCHLEYVFERFNHHGSFAEFASRHRYPDNFEGCITTFCDPTAFSPSFGIWQSLLSEPNVWGTFGTHPHNAKYYDSSSLEEKMLACLSHPKCVAVGEIGLDYAPHSPSPPEVQRSVLSRQLELAVRLGKPVVLHCRDAEKDLFDILSSTVPREWRVHLHCFTGSQEITRKFLKNFENLYVGVCGNVTYDSTRVQGIAAWVPLERLLLETDAPYMIPRNIPQHLRGNKFSHPSLAFYTAKKIADIRCIHVAEVLKSLRDNTRSMYGI